MPHVELTACKPYRTSTRTSMVAMSAEELKRTKPCEYDSYEYEYSTVPYCGSRSAAGIIRDTTGEALNNTGIEDNTILVALVGEGKGPGCGLKFAGSRSRVPVRVQRSKPYGNSGAILYDYDAFSRPPKYKYLCPRLRASPLDLQLPPYIGCYSLHLCLCTYSLLSCALLVIKYLCLVRYYSDTDTYILEVE